MKNRIIFFALALLCLPVFAGPKLKERPGKIPYQYIVVFEDSVNADAVPEVSRELASNYHGEVLEVWSAALRGALMRLAPGNAEKLSKDQTVRFVEEDAAFSMPLLSGTVGTDPNGQYLWYLDRLDEPHFSDRDHSYNMCNDASSHPYAYVIDSGVRADHEQFQGRIVYSRDFTPDTRRPGVGGAFQADSTNGCTGYPLRWHGTSVAALLTGKDLGASRVKVVSLKVGRCDDGVVATSYLISAINWIASSSNPYLSSPGVVNHSGLVPPWDSEQSSYSLAAEDLVANTGFPFFTSADNQQADACLFAPNDRSFTRPTDPGNIFVVAGSLVAAPAHNDHRWHDDFPSAPFPSFGSGSNGGDCVSIFAPGWEIYTAESAPDSYHTVSGTSFASPLVAAVAARYVDKMVGQQGYAPSAYDVYSWLLGNATTQVYDSGVPEQWICYKDGDYQTHPTEPNPSDPDFCFGGYQKFYSPGYATTDARMVFWDEGVCP